MSLINYTACIVVVRSLNRHGLNLKGLQQLPCTSMQYIMYLVVEPYVLLRFILPTYHFQVDRNENEIEPVQDQMLTRGTTASGFGCGMIQQPSTLGGGREK